MSGSRFAQLSLVDKDDNDGVNSSGEDTEKSGKKSSHKKNRNKKKNKAIKTRSSLFTWQVLTDNNLNKTIPRGLVNRSNFCYLNAVLQPLLLCQPFINVILNLQDKIRQGNEYKWLSAFLELASAFSFNESEKGNEKTRIVNPECVYKCWDHSDDQEDAEEFLRLILNGLHDELLAHKQALEWDLPTLTEDLKAISKQTVEDEWISVKRGQKGATSRQLLEPPSPISVLFNGQFKSIVQQKNARESHVYEPFQFLPLDITNGSKSITEAIEKMITPESVSQSVTRVLLIDRLPPILIIQLKRIIYDPKTFTTSKSCVSIDIPTELDLSDIVDNYGDSVFFGNDEPPVYRLTAVVYHLGRSTHGGHYTCHVLHDDAWYFCDDGAVQTAPREVVGQTDRNRTPYLVFYCRYKV